MKSLDNFLVLLQDVMLTSKIPRESGYNKLFTLMSASVF